MADIIMCDGGKCPLKETCYRFKATPNEYRQSYFLEEPFVETKNGVICNHYWKHEGDNREE
jgi:hypothetical protein